DRAEHDVWLAAALAKFTTIEEPARQAHDATLALNDRRLEAMSRARRAEDNKRRAEADDRARGATLPASYDEKIAAETDTWRRLEAEYGKAQARWRELNAPLAVLREFLHVPGRRIADVVPGDSSSRAAASASPSASF